MALQHVTGEGDLSLVVSVAGAGKSTMLGAARQVWETEGYTVKGARFPASQPRTWKAQVASPPGRLRLGRWLGRRAGSLEPTRCTRHRWAGLIGTRQLAGVLEQAQAAGAKVVMVGDPEQLQAIEEAYNRISHC